jgi:serine/threonine protein kinase/tetratricopeptide (TPR) repeat protein
MEICALTDSPASTRRELKKCPNCGSASRLENALCLNCLLQGALEDGVVAPAKATFKETLAAMDFRVAEWRIGEFEILDEIGRGGMGVIYRAREPHSGRIVALKCVLGYHVDSDQTLARFRREAETAARLDHPNIMPVYHVGEDDDGLPFFTMKFASGGSLARTRGTLHQDFRTSALLTAKIARAVEYAHNQGVLHRDLKPGNILLDHRQEPLVSDFGLAKWQDTSTNLTRSLAIFGTPGYIAPEQAEGPAALLTPAADVYSLGAILFELLTGRAPFLGEHALAVIRQAAEKTAPKLRSLAPHLDRDLETICARSLEREPSARYQSCRDLAQDLQNWLEDRPIRARPVGIAVQSGRWLRRNRLLGGTIIASCALAAASILWQVRSWKFESAMSESTLAQRSVLVMPFVNLDDLTPDPILAASIATSLQKQLGPLGPARVTSLRPQEPVDWSSNEQVRKAGQNVNARTVLTGTKRTVGGKTHISIRLLDAATGNQLLTYVGQIKEHETSKDVGEEIAQSVDAILNAKDWSNLLRPDSDPGLHNDGAREAITAGREVMSHYTTSDYDKAIALFRKAVRAQPDSSVAHSYLAIAATERTHYNADPSFLELGKAEAEKAIQLSPHSRDAHRALAGVYYQEGKFSEAIEEDMRTIEIGGLEEKVVRFVALTFDMLGQPDRALTWYSVARGSAATPGEMDAAIGDCWAKLCNDTEAVQAYNRAMELRPNSPQGAVGICHMRLLEGNFEGARQSLSADRWNRRDLGDVEQMMAQTEFFARNFNAAEKLYSDLANTDSNGGGSFYGAISYQSALARAKQALGDYKEANTLLQGCLTKEEAAVAREPANPEAVYRLAAVEASLGMSERALGHLRKAMASGWIDYRSLALDPRFDSLRKKPELGTILRDLFVRVADMRPKIAKH